MKGKLEALEGYQPRTLSAAEIRNRVERIAEDLAEQIRLSGAGLKPLGSMEAIPVDNRHFIQLMSGFIMMN